MTHAWDEMVLVGRVARAHGNRGQVIIDPATDFPEERFKPGAVLHALNDGRIEPLVVEEVRFHRGRPIVRFSAVRDMDAAESMAARELRVPVESLQTLPAGAFYRHDLVGCEVETTGGEAVGLVTAVEGDAAGSRLVVAARSGEVLIPLAEGICTGISIDERKIIVNPLEGLLDLNVVRRQRF